MEGSGAAAIGRVKGFRGGDSGGWVSHLRGKKVVMDRRFKLSSWDYIYGKTTYKMVVIDLSLSICSPWKFLQE